LPKISRIRSTEPLPASPGCGGGCAEGLGAAPSVLAIASTRSPAGIEGRLHPLPLRSSVLLASLPEGCTGIGIGPALAATAHSSSVRGAGAARRTCRSRGL
jgi:hypothetical protein